MTPVGKGGVKETGEKLDLRDNSKSPQLLEFQTCQRRGPRPEGTTGPTIVCEKIWQGAEIWANGSRVLVEGI